jgi:hypothetical protein
VRNPNPTSTLRQLRVARAWRGARVADDRPHTAAGVARCVLARSRSPLFCPSPAARAAARRAVPRSISTRAWTTSRRSCAQTPNDSFSTVRPCASRFPERSRFGGLKEDTAFFTGKGADEQFVATIPVTVDEALLARGRQRYGIYCEPCHDARGDGKGICSSEATSHARPSTRRRSEVPGRANLRRHHERDGTDARVPLADPPCGQVGDHRLRARAPARAAGTRRGRGPRAPSEGGTVANGLMNAR